MDVNNRREFLKKAALGMAVGVAGQTICQMPAHAQGTAAKPPGKLDMVKPSESQAQALGYVEDANKADVKKFPKRATPEGKKQYCYNCQFYQTTAADPKSVAEAPCTLFANRGVKGMGWCNSWAQNPKVKM